MAKFPIQRAEGTLPGRAGAVRARIDVDTGEQLVAEAVAGFGGAVANLGMKYYNIQAATQLSKAERLAVEEMNRLSLSFEGNLDPETYLKEYENSLKTIQASTGAVLTNKMAANNFGLFLDDRQPRWENDVRKAQKARILDNRLEEVFNKQSDIRQSGIYGDFSEFIAETVRDVDGFDKSDGARIIAQTKRMAAVGAELNLIDSYWQKAKKMPINQANEFINDAAVLTGAQRNDLIARRKRQEEIVTATTNRKVRWDTLRKVTKNPQNVTDEWLESLVKPNSLTWDDAEEFKKIRDDKAEPLKTPRAQLYFNSLDELFDKRETDADERMKWDVANEKLVQYFKENPNATAKQAAEFYDDLINPEVEGMIDRAFRFWLQSPFGILGRKVLGVEKGKKSPYPEYPDAFLEDGVWKVTRDGKKYRIE